MIPIRRTLAALLALGAVGLACGSGGDADGLGAGNPDSNDTTGGNDGGGPTGSGTAPDSSAPESPPPHGFRADYFDGFYDLALTRYEPTIAFERSGTTAPDPKLRPFLYSIRYSATLAAPQDGEYEFETNSDDGARVFVDDKIVIDDWASHPALKTQGKVTLGAGDHALRVEYFQQGGGASLTLAWTPPGGTAATLPEAALTPLTTAPADAKGAPLRGPRPEFTNPVVPFDCPDPGIFRDEGARPTFYMVCTGGAFRIRTSDDLVTWTDTGKVILFGGKAAWSANGGRNWAPEIHKVGAKYVAYYTAADGNDNLAIGAATADSPLGPWTDKGSPMVQNAVGVIDATYFEDDDKKKYLYWKLDGNSVGQATPMFVRELKDNGIEFAAGSTAVQVLTNNTGSFEGGVVEAPWIVKRNGMYYMFYSANVYDDRYRTSVARAASPKGPFTKRGAVILGNNAAWVGPGHGSVVVAHGADYFFHHAWPALANGKHDTGKGRFGLIAPITWKDGWPVIGNGSSVVAKLPWP